MDSFKVLCCFGFIAAANCYVIASDNLYHNDKYDAETFYETFGEDGGEVQLYRPRREVHYGEEKLETIDNLESSYTNDGDIVVVSDVLYRPKRQNRNSVSVTADHQHRQGTNLNVEAQRNLWRSNNGRSSLDAQANYNRQFGHGGGRPNYGAGVTFRHRF